MVSTKINGNRIHRVRLVIIVFLTIIFLISAWKLCMVWQDDRLAEHAYAQAREEQQIMHTESHFPSNAELPTAIPARTTSMDFSSLQEINDDVVAWIVCDGTQIDYPVLHTDDNDYYLRRLYTGEHSRAGSIFIDCRNTSSFTDKNTVIYGHNMKNGTMFSDLMRYKDQDHYDEFPTIRINTPDGDFLVDLVAGTIESGNEEFLCFDFENDTVFLKYVEDFQAHSVFQSDVQVAPTDRIVTLCTCSYEHNNARFIIIGRLTEIYNNDE